MIYTAIVKRLPSMTWFLKYLKDAEEYNKVRAALYDFFDSRLLTKGDYIHIIGVLAEKFPLYEANRDAAAFADIAVRYATYQYPSNPDIEKAIRAFAAHVESMNPRTVNTCLAVMRKQLPEASDFVGCEAIGEKKTITQTPMTDEELVTIKRMIRV